MAPSTLQALGAFALLAPFLAIFLLTAYYFAQRAYWRRHEPLRRRLPGAYVSTLALGMAVQILQVFYQPSVEFEIQAKLVEQVEDEDEREPDSSTKHLLSQFRRIRRGDPVDTLVVRL